MDKKSDLEVLFKGILNRTKESNGKIVGEGNEIIEIKLAKDDRGAWVNHLVEQYLKKEELDIPPEDLNITRNDVLNEIVQREIDKILGK